jgi:hypothetical protein
MNVYCVDPTILKSKKKNNCQILLKKAETGVVVIVFNGVLCHVSVYTITVSLYMNKLPE